MMNQPIVCCALGALAVELLRFIEASRRPPELRPDYKAGEFYIAFAFSILVAMIVGYVYFDGATTLGKAVYFHTGASSPLLVRALSSTLPAAISPTKSGKGRNLRI